MSRSQATRANRPIKVFPRDVLDTDVARVSFFQKPGNTAAACAYLSMFLKAADLKQYYYVMAPAVSLLCLVVSSIQDHAAAATAEAETATVLAWKGEMRLENWWCTGLPRDVLDTDVARMSFSQKPGTIAAACAYLSMFPKVADLQQYYYVMAPAVSSLCLDGFSTQDHAAAATAEAETATVIAWRGERFPENWRRTEQMMSVSGDDGSQQLVHDGGDATLPIHKGKELEVLYDKYGTLPDPNSVEYKCIVRLLKDTISVDKSKRTCNAAYRKGASEETITSVHRLKELIAKGELFFPVIYVNDCDTRSKFDNAFGCRLFLPDGFMRATDVMIGGKRALT